MSAKLSGRGKRLTSPGKGQNRWNDEQKLTLHMMFATCGLGTEEATAIFNTIYAHHLRSCGLPNGLEARAIRVQYGERTRATGAKIWRVITSEATTPEEITKREGICNQIRLLSPSRHVAARHSTPKSLDPPQTVASSASAFPIAERKRAWSTVSTAPDTDFASTSQIRPLPKKPKLSQRSGMVLISKSERDAAIGALTPIAATSPKRPSTPKHRVIRSDHATVLYKRHPSQGDIWLTPEEFAKTQEDYIPPPEDVARPHVPLLFRYWTDRCQSPLGEQGFVAGRFARTVIKLPRPPPLSDPAWTCIGDHLNREETASPFISTSNNLAWIIRLALRELRDGAEGGRISVIDPTALMKHGAVLHAQPYQRELCIKAKPFDKGAFRYHGMHEFLVWAKIPREAIMTTVPLSSLLNFARTEPSVGDLLRLEQLSKKGKGYATTILPEFKMQDITLTPQCIIAMAKICMSLGQGVLNVEGVISLVTDIIQGWGIILRYQTPDEWAGMARVFADEMCAHGDHPYTFVDHHNMQYAFLEGCRWGCGDANVKQKPDKMSAMLYRAKKIGISQPAQILVSRFNAAKMSVMQYDKKSRALLRNSGSRALLAEPDEIDDAIIPDHAESEGVWTMVEGSSRRRRQTTVIRTRDWQAIDDSDDDSDGSIYEL